MINQSIIGAVCTCLAVVSFNVNAIPTYEFSAGGTITGISGLVIDNKAWDLTIHNTEFYQLGAAAVYDQAFAISASDAIVQFTNAQAVEPLANQFYGCHVITAVKICEIATVFEYVDLATDFNAHFAQINDFVVPDLSLPTGPMPGPVYQWAPNRLWATWAESANVPEPSIAILMASGLIAFGVVRRKSRT